MKLIFSIFGSLFFFVQGYGQTNIDFHNKRLNKELAKEGISHCEKLVKMKNSSMKDNIINLDGQFFKLPPECVLNGGYLYVGRVNCCRAGGCSRTSNMSFSGHSEFFDYFIVFGNDKTVRKVKVFNYQATHGYEITSKGWLKQFIGYKADDQLEVEKNIDAISGATVSVYAITRDVALKAKLLSLFNDE